MRYNFALESYRGAKMKSLVCLVLAALGDITSHRLERLGAQQPCPALQGLLVSNRRPTKMVSRMPACLLATEGVLRQVFFLCAETQMAALKLLLQLANRNQAYARDLVAAGVVAHVADTMRHHGKPVIPVCLGLLHALMSWGGSDAVAAAQSIREAGVLGPGRD